MGTAHLLGLLGLFTGISVLQQVISWSINVPTEVTTVEGSCVVVPCQTESHSRVIWYQYHSTNYPVVYDGLRPQTAELQFRGRTSVLGKAAEGNCTLIIDNVRIADNRLRIYVWINPDSKTTQKFYDQTVTIIVERTTPTISIQRRLLEGEMFQANCSIKYSCPFSPPLLHWNKSPFLDNSTFNFNFNKEVPGQWLYTETLHGLATYEMRNSRMRCSAQFRTFTTESQEMTLNILYKPVEVTLMLEKEAVMEGGSIITECAANCNPQPHTYSWFRRQTGQNDEINSTQRRMAFHDITRNTFLSCMAHNDIGAGRSDWVDLDVQYVPVILPETSCSLTGDVLKCVCLAEASPNASIYWIIDGNATLPSSFTSVSTYKTNVLSGVISVPAGGQTNVSCTAWNPLGSDTKQLFVRNLSKTFSLLVWLSSSVLLGIALLLGCALILYRKYPRNRQLPGCVCYTISLRSQNSSSDVQQEQRCNLPHRSQDDEDTQSNLHRPERDPEVDRLSCVYDNDCVEEIRRSARVQPHQGSEAALQREGETQRLAKVQRNVCSGSRQTSLI